MSGHNDARAHGRGRVYQASGDQHIIENHHHEPEWSGPDTVRRPARGQAPVVLRDRAELMSRLREAVGAETGGQVYVLHGLGGCGKTAVAAALFEHATAEAGRVGLWVNASDTTSLRSGMLAVAADRGAAEGELTAARSGLRAASDLVWGHLDRSAEPWLLVLDNADDPVVLRDGGWLRPSPRGTVLVTTRQAAAHWWPGAELLQVGVLPRDDAALVLRDLAPGTGTVEEAAETADRLGRLPLALTLAGSFLSHQVIDPWTLTRYGNYLDGDQAVDPIELLDQGAAALGDDSRHLVSRTWQLSLDALANQGLPEAHSLLRLLACWGNDPLPLSLLAGAEAGPELPAARVEPALRGLLDHSLTELVPGSTRCLRTHGVLLDSVAGGTPLQQREELLAKAAERLLDALPEVPERGLKTDLFNLLAPHVFALLRRAVGWEGIDRRVIEMAAECALRLVVVLHRAGDYASALDLSNRAIDLLKQPLGEEHVLIVRIRQRLGRTLHRLGRFEEAESLMRDVLAECERLFGPDSLDTLESCLVLSHPLWLLDRTAESVPLLRRVVVGRTAILGPVHPLTFIARNHLLGLPRGPELEEEVAAGANLAEDCHQALGPAHPVTLLVESEYAYALSTTGRFVAALPLARDAFRRNAERYGTDYPGTLNARQLLSRTLAGLGELPEAIVHAEAVLIGRKRVLGPSHPWTLLAQENLSKYLRPC